jgi:dipeptidyl aminopeptidase/acylaminoacyl peptidase
LLLLLALLPLLVGCGGPDPTAQIVVVTATFTPKPAVQVVTATFTPAPAVAATKTLAAPSQTKPKATMAEATPVPPTATQAESQPTETVEATATLAATETATTAPKPVQPRNPSNSWLVVYTVCQPPRNTESYSLWQMRGDGTEVEQVINLASEPAFSANGQRMVYYKWIEGLRVVFMDRNPQEEIVSRGDGNASFPSMSPNGQQIVYHQIPPNWSGQFTLRICDADGQNDRPLTPGSRPAWSPKGGLIAYDSCNQSNQCGIFVIQPSGQGMRQLTTDAGGGPAWSPDGQRIAYSSQADGDTEIYVVNLDGSGLRQLTKNKGNDALPAWSPDGNSIYYRSDNNGQGWSIMVMGADGSNPRKLVNAPACDLWNFEKLAVTK